MGSFERMARIKPLASGCPEATEVPESPPRDTPMAESSRRPPDCLSGPWHEMHLDASNAWASLARDWLSWPATVNSVMIHGSIMGEPSVPALGSIGAYNKTLGVGGAESTGPIIEAAIVKLEMSKVKNNAFVSSNVA